MTTLSIVIALLCACVSFIPSSPKEALPPIVIALPPGANPEMASFDDMLSVLYLMENVETVEENARPWLGRYRFTVSAIDGNRYPGIFRAVVAAYQAGGNDEFGKSPRRLLEKWGQKGNDVTHEQLKDFLREQLTDACHLDVLSLTLVSEKHNSARFQVEANGTPALFPLWSHRFNLLFGAYKIDELAIPLGTLVFVIENYVVGYSGAAVAMLISTIITAFFIPNMLRKGTIDLLVSKPISRSA